MAECFLSVCPQQGGAGSQAKAAPGQALQSVAEDDIIQEEDEDCDEVFDEDYDIVVETASPAHIASDPSSAVKHARTDGSLQRSAVHNAQQQIMASNGQCLTGETSANVSGTRTSQEQARFAPAPKLLSPEQTSSTGSPRPGVPSIAYMSMPGAGGAGTSSMQAGAFPAGQGTRQQFQQQRMQQQEVGQQIGVVDASGPLMPSEAEPAQYAVFPTSVTVEFNHGNALVASGIASGDMKGSAEMSGGGGARVWDMSGYEDVSVHGVPKLRNDSRKSSMDEQFQLFQQVRNPCESVQNGLVVGTSAPAMCLYGVLISTD